MTLQEAIDLRHSVRRYDGRPISEEIAGQINTLIGKINRDTQLHIQLVRDEPKTFSGGLAYGTFHGVKSYLVLAGENTPDAKKAIGYWGEYLVLQAQCLGIDSCWVGLTYRNTKNAWHLNANEKVHCLIALGYGAEHGKPHKIRKATEVSNISDTTPIWFQKGVESALKAPTAVNQQRFYFKYTKNGLEEKVEATTRFSFIGYTLIDLGIAQLHFEIASGRKL